ncbi:MAG TPA: maltose alpha-D-glucosyltransferase [Vicinamibacterales bacterium]|nr:maltose alpha-D-glucosyltransferase [Vicinamibacterales bacterium]
MENSRETAHATLERGTSLEFSTNRAPSPSHWYKDAVIYQVHVRGFFDSDDDGIGDFEGLTRKLDYIQSLGVSCVWLQPFYPSPLKDDGYDIAHYEGVHKSYGTLKHFRSFLDEAHARGLRVITELVINHTSDQHPWFQAARRARPGSRKRDYYVWSDSDQKYANVRIIFSDTERSNWTWDPVAGAYYWHRFFHHQPDLNFDNPQVRKAVTRVMRFWLDQGVDGMRLDAVPYLIEREGTSCANLPETHDVLRGLRRDMDARHHGRMLLAEANLWPSDVAAYFGDGDECHMAFHFPLMPRLYMALRQEDRHPISEILYQTPEIPESCQWAIFLRNHDELTLEMVADDERDYMYQAYAADPQMRVNAGIRRRLAPLMENSRARIELLNGLLLSLPGTPVIYYGDELGMGDNVYLGDRNAVRTPMQWTADRNAGFSRADPARLYAPVIMDSVYGYQSVNVEAQERAPHSRLNWMRRLIALRQRHRTFGRGAIELLRPENRRVFAFVRRLEGEDPILVVANMARTMQPASLDLSRFAGLVPIEMSGGTDLPRIGETPYFLTLAPHGFSWLELKRQAPEPITVRPLAHTAGELEQMPVLLGEDWSRTLGSTRSLLERRYLASFLRRQRWFQKRAAALADARLSDWATIRGGKEPVMATLVTAKFEDGHEDRYFMPLAMASGARADKILQHAPDGVLARIAGASKGVLHGSLEPDVAREFFAAIADTRTIDLRQGQLVASRTAAFDDIRTHAPDADVTAVVPSVERANSSIRFGERYVLKLVRRIWPGPSHEVELGRFLTERAHFPRAPRLAGTIDVRASGETSNVALLHAFVPHQMDGWRQALSELERYFDSAVAWDVAQAQVDRSLQLSGAAVPESARRTVGAAIESASTLGRRTAELHLTLAGDEARSEFGTATLDAAWVDAMVARAGRQAETTLAALSAAADRPMPVISSKIDTLLAAHHRLMTSIDDLARRVPTGLQLTRVHGAYDLGQVLLSEADFVIIDFEGDPAQPMEERRRLNTPLRDVANMVRSFQYAAGASLSARVTIAPQDAERITAWARWWHTWTTASFLAAYQATAAGAAFLPADPHGLDALLKLLLIEQSLAEIRRELADRPEYMWIPLQTVMDVI